MAMTSEDRYDLARFVDAQADTYDQALLELRNGRKRSHWMWWVFPQFAGLGVSATSQRYAIKSAAEAKAYLAHPVLGPRLLESVEALLAIDECSAVEILGSPDDMKLRSCATLFAQFAPPASVFHRLLDKYFGGEADVMTLRVMNAPR